MSNMDTPYLPGSLKPGPPRAPPVHNNLRLQLCENRALCYDGAIMITRTQISLDPEMKRQARERAAQLGVSFAEYIRRLVARDLGEPEQRTDPSVVFNLGDSGGADVARRKDVMVGEAVAAEKGRDRGEE